MQVSVQSSDKLTTIALPSNVGGSRWIEDADGTRLAHALGEAGSWRIEPAGRISVVTDSGPSSDAVVIDPTTLRIVTLRDDLGRGWSLVFFPDYEGSLMSATYGFKGDVDITIGRGANNAICYPSEFVSGNHARLSYAQGSWSICDLGSSNGVFVNGVRIPINVPMALSYGDFIAIFGLRLTVGRALFSCNSPCPSFAVSDSFVRYRAPRVASDAPAYHSPKEHFYPALRFARAVDPKEFEIDDPPPPQEKEEESLAMRIGPSLVMGLASAMSAAVFVMMITESGGSPIRALPMIVMAVAMLTGCVLWPILNARSTRKKQARLEAQRRASYSQYINKVRTEIAREMELQKEILSENRISVQECLDRGVSHDSRLMNRTSMHADYLDVRLGLGDEPFQAKIRFPEKHFTLVEDDLSEAVWRLAEEPRILQNVPIALSLIEKSIIGVIGAPQRTTPFLRGMAMQIAALSSYEDVKCMFLFDSEDRAEWEFATCLPHSFTDDMSLRFLACGAEEASELGFVIDHIIETRRAANRFAPREAEPYYVVFCSSETLAARADCIKKIVEQPSNLGISLIAVAREMKDLPKECRIVVGLEESGAYLLDRDDPSGRQRMFVDDISVGAQQAEAFARSMGSLSLDLSMEGQALPSHLGFLEMFHAANKDYLNIEARWRENSASDSLACRIGVDPQGEPFLLNLHERFHGPHGLIAGTTGSGKSELIITYILSMALTYSPDDVAFVLIDYKGGGLAKAFDNEHVRLPHLAGVITNLDGASISRSLVSIQSELKHRQELFNMARDIAGGENVDIYDYLDLYRQGKVSEPCPHLFIVADEFAELKQQQPDFMDELISAARIGRSLGVHLILATQKPSGVVNDQIWSNSRFKISLKVADANDSKEMIHRPDAAELTDAGRFYMLVGYNELFAIGQSAYTGTRYVPKERFESTKDDSVALISNTGRTLVAVNPTNADSEGDGRSEAIVLLEQVEQVADNMDKHARQLWLEPIPAEITIDGVARKYGIDLEPQPSWDLDALIGEYDDPEHQKQGALRVPLTREGSALLYGTPDSGVETVLYSMVYSLLRMHDFKTLNAYLLDFGSESLRAFAEAPQVGDVICSNEAEKVERFFDFIERELAERRALFAPYGGSIERYATEHDDKASLLVVVNDIAAFLELYPKLEDRMGTLTREAGRSGLHLVMTGASTGAVRMRMRSNFRQAIACNLADSSEYGMVFGSIRGVPEPYGFARGLARVDGSVLEFQGARLTEDGSDFSFASAYCTGLAEETAAIGPDAPRARAIPTVPKAVTPEVLSDIVGGSVPADLLPYGVYEDSLEVATVDFEESPIARIMYQRKKSAAAFVRALTEFTASQSDWDVVVLDVAGLFGEAKPQGCAYATRKPDLAKDKLLELLTSNLSKRTIVILTGVGELINAASFEEGAAVKAALQGMRTGGSTSLLLIDSTVDFTYGYDDWFKAHVGARDGVWIGPGAETQTQLQIITSFNRKIPADNAMRAGRGIAVEGGTPRVVKTLTDEKDVNVL